MRKSLLASALILLAIEAPADACHRFSIWHYRQPQACGLAHRMRFRAQAQGVPMPHKPIPPRAIAPGPAPSPDIPLPDLRDIEWGSVAQDSDRGRLMLHAIYGKDSQ